MFNKRIISVILALLILLAALPLSIMFTASAAEVKIGILKDGGFETNNSWTVANGRTEVSDAFEGDYVVSASQIAKDSVKFNVKEYALVSVGFWYKNSVLDAEDKFFVKNNSGEEVASATIKAAEDWTYSEFTFKCESAAEKHCFSIKGKDFYIDAVTAFYKKVGNLAENSSFEEGNRSWVSFGEGMTVDTDNVYEGFVASKLNNGEKSGIYSEFSVSENTDYTVTFMYMGGGENSGYAVADAKSSLTDTGSFIAGKNVFQSTNEWKSAEISFNSGLNEKLRFAVYGGTSGALYIDCVEIKVSSTQNIVKNGGFEENSAYWSVSDGSTNLIQTDNTNSGKKSLRLPLGKYVSVYQYLESEKNTEYIVSCAVWTGDGNEWSVIRITGDNDKNVGGDSLGQQTFNGESGIWKECTFVINSGDYEYLCLELVTEINQKKLTRVDDICIRKKPVSTEDYLIVKNGGFENGMSYWTTENAETTPDETFAYNGNASLKLAQRQYAHVYQTVKVKPGARYHLSMYVYGGDGEDWSAISIQAGENWETLITNISLRRGAGNWYYVTQEFESGEYSDLRIKITTDSATSTLRLDDIGIIPIEEGNYVINGSFEGTKTAWSTDSDVFAVNSDSKSGDMSLGAFGGYHKKIYQRIELEPEKNYELSFWYKGKMPDAISVWAVSTDETFTDSSVINKGVLQDATEYTHVKTVFSTGKNTTVYVLFQTDSASQYVIDGVWLKDTNESAKEFTEIKKAEYSDSFSGTFYGHTFYVTKPQNNLFTNGEFEGEKGIANALISDGVSVVTDAKAVFEGEKGLMFNAGPDQTIATARLKLEKNKTYYLSLFTKYPQYDSYNHGYITYGIADSDTGDYLIIPGNTYDKEHQIIPCAADNKWHLQGLSFKTNDQTDFTFTIMGKNALAYFDNIAIFESGKEEAFVSDVEKVKDVSITDENPKLLGVKEASQNLIENFDFSEMEKYWVDEKGTVYGDTLNVVDSKHSVQKNAFYYKSNRKNPLSIYYIKWIDVKPNTEYTFSVKYSIESAGLGHLGLVSGHSSDYYKDVTDNLIYPSKILTVQFNGDNYDENHNWQTNAVSFNTNDRNRVGFVMLDKGGSAYIDDIRLFETKNAAAVIEEADTTPASIVSDSKLVSVSNGLIKGVDTGTKISSLLKSLKDSSYLRVFEKSGKEITDYSSVVATGLEVRLMNGPVIKDRATLIVKGDVNGDGAVNNDDKAAVLKHISREETLEDCYLGAADYDGDGEVTVKDLLHNSSTPTKGEVNFSVTGPEKFGQGYEIKLLLKANKDNLKALSGIIKFNRNGLTLESIDANSEKWSVSYKGSSSEVYFAAAVSDDNAASKKDEGILTFTFTVGEISSYNDAAVSFQKLMASSGGDLLTCKDFVWTVGKVTKSETDESDKTVDAESEENASEPDSGKDFISDDFDSELNEGEIVQTEVAARNRLSVLKLDEAEIAPEFDPEIKEYTATVPFTVEEVTVTAIAADEDATVTIGDTKLEYVGNNLVTVKVVSADGLQRTYKIMVAREAPVNSTQSGMPLWLIIVIIAGAALVVAGGVFAVIVIKRKNKKV